MQDSVLNLCRVKLRDQQRLEKIGYLEEYPQYPNGVFTDVVPRGGNAGGGGQPGWVLKCKGWEEDPNAYIYFTIQEQNWENTCIVLNKKNGLMIQNIILQKHVSLISLIFSLILKNGYRIKISLKQWRF